MTSSPPAPLNANDQLTPIRSPRPYYPLLVPTTQKAVGSHSVAGTFHALFTPPAHTNLRAVRAPPFGSAGPRRLRAVSQRRSRRCSRVRRFGCSCSGSYIGQESD